MKKTVKNTKTKRASTAKRVKVQKKAVAKKTAKKLVKKATAKASVKSVATKNASARKPVAKRQRKGKDTGSVEVQIDNFTVKIKSLIKHLKKHNGDNDSRRGLLIMVGKRRRLLNYIKKSDPKRYAKVISKLKLKE